MSISRNDHQPPSTPFDYRLDFARPSRARLTNLLLGGNEAFEVDRRVLGELKAIAADIDRFALDEAGFVERAWRYLSEVIGIRQVIHCGAPLSPGRPPHHVAWENTEILDQGPVIYVEPDPVLAAKGRVFLADHETISVADTDPTDLDAMLGNLEVSQRLDFRERVLVIAPGLLHQVSVERAADLVTGFGEQLAPGSVIAATHALDPETEDGTALAQRMQDVFEHGAMPTYFRTKADIAALFSGYDLFAPGVVRCSRWWPSGPQLRPRTPCEQLNAGVVAKVVRAP
ncbi:SAM-dependent methyltransferase [Amycolatopsis sp. NPDC058986]|uniref:SAM-dependent methyltransferase n=1 Tax=unclassified Amycolatopsis TaxID=2618356 RepID=UPI0036727643